MARIEGRTGMFCRCDHCRDGIGEALFDIGIVWLLDQYFPTISGWLARAQSTSQPSSRLLINSRPRPAVYWPFEIVPPDQNPITDTAVPYPLAPLHGLVEILLELLAVFSSSPEAYDTEESHIEGLAS
jgi:hypothetical protein